MNTELPTELFALLERYPDNAVAQTCLGVIRGGVFRYGGGGHSASTASLRRTYRRRANIPGNLNYPGYVDFLGNLDATTESRLAGHLIDGSGDFFAIFTNEALTDLVGLLWMPGKGDWEKSGAGSGSEGGLTNVRRFHDAE